MKYSNKVKVRAGRLGGLETRRKYGTEYFSRIGKMGAAVMHERYRIEPFALSLYAMVHRETGVIKTLLSARPGSVERSLPW